MGEAKRRGTFEERKAAAVIRDLEKDIETAGVKVDDTFSLSNEDRNKIASIIASVLGPSPLTHRR